MKKYSFLCLALCAALLITGCGKDGGTDQTLDGQLSNSATSGDANVTVSGPVSSSDVFSDRDYEVGYDENESTHITLKGDSVECSSGSVQISGTTVTITEEGTYILSGTLDDGMIIINTDKKEKIQLVLDGVTILSETSAPIYIQQTDKVFLTLASDSVNSLSNGGTFTAIDENNIDAVIFSKEDLTMNGSGVLTVTSPAGHGIVSKDSLTITSGTYEINSASHGMTGKDDVSIANASFTITAGKDGIHGENADDTELGFVYIESGNFEISAEGDGISASAHLQIQGGSFDITTGGGSENGDQQSSDSWGDFMGGRNPGGNGGGGFGGGSMGGSSSSASDEDSTSIKGIKADGDLVINGGTFTIDSADDAVHSNANVTINGGTFEIATGDDGIHAEDTLTILNCSMNISDAYEGLEAEKIYVQGGEMVMQCSDDGLNASGGADSSGTTGGRDGMFGGGMGMSGTNADAIIDISGGSLTIRAGGDCLDSNGNMTMSGGYVYATNYTSGDVSVLDSQNAPVITGGTYIGLGISTTMAETFSSSSSQGVIACTVGRGQNAGSQITISDTNDNVLVDVTAEYSVVLLIISTPDIVKGETYNITVGTVSGQLQAS